MSGGRKQPRGTTRSCVWATGGDLSHCVAWGRCSGGCQADLYVPEQKALSLLSLVGGANELMPVLRAEFALIPQMHWFGIFFKKVRDGKDVPLGKKGKRECV